MTEHDIELREMFDKVTAPLPSGPDQNMRVISFEGFQLAISKFMDKAYYLGKMEVARSVESIFNESAV